MWVRGYGLVDSKHVRAAAGKPLNLTAAIAPDPRAAAQYYPAGYWFSLIHVPEKSEFPGTGTNGIAPGMKTQADWLRTMKSGTCLACHALGTKATREIPVALDAMSPTDAWMRRINSGQAGVDMMRGMTSLGMGRAVAMFSDWTTRIAKGKSLRRRRGRRASSARSSSPSGTGRIPKAYLHDEVSTDRRNPRLNPNG